jgi:hypothetical protein
MVTETAQRPLKRQKWSGEGEKKRIWERQGGEKICTLLDGD